MSWSNVSHHGYTVITETLKTVQSRQVNSSEFSVPPGTDFFVIGNYGSTNLSASTHMEMFVADVAGGTFVQRGLSVAGFNSTTAAIDNARVNLINDVSSVREWPRYKIKIPSGGGLVKLVVSWGKVPSP